MRIKKTYNLAGLKVSLITESSDARIRIELETTESHTPQTIHSWEVTAAEFGMPARFDPDRVRGQGYKYHLPHSFQRELQGMLWKVVRRHDPPEMVFGPLWLHLVKPYGYLGLVPWEELLAGTVEFPILRLPDVWSSPPNELPSTLDVALCASEPLAKSPFDLEKNLNTITEHLLGAPRSRVRVDIFTDVRYFGPLKDHWASRGELNTRVFVHDPSSAAEYAVPSRKRGISAVDDVESPWLLWIRQALQGRSVDLIHFLTHGYMSSTKGALAFAESPMLNRDAAWSRFVGADELSLFLCQLGAWCVVIDSPGGNYSEMGLRAVADELAQHRPGPTLHHESRLDDPHLSQLKQAFDFLFDPEPASPSRTPCIALCCQPFRVAGYEERMKGTLAVDTTLAQSVPTFPRKWNPSRVVNTFEAWTREKTPSQANIPAWIAAAQRYVEQKEFELNQVRKTTADRQLTPTSARATGVERGLREISEAIALLAERSEGKQ